MDDKPFLVLDLAAVDSTHLPELAKLTRESGRSCPRPFQVWFVPVRHTLGETVAGRPMARLGRRGRREWNGRQLCRPGQVCDGEGGSHPHRVQPRQQL